MQQGLPNENLAYFAIYYELGTIWSDRMYVYDYAYVLNKNACKCKMHAKKIHRSFRFIVPYRSDQIYWHNGVSVFSIWSLSGACFRNIRPRDRLMMIGMGDMMLKLFLTTFNFNHPCLPSSCLRDVICSKTWTYRLNLFHDSLLLYRLFFPFSFFLTYIFHVSFHLLFRASFKPSSVIGDCFFVPLLILCS